MNTHGGSYPYYSEEMSSSYNHPRQNSGNYPIQNQMSMNPNMGGFNQYSGFEENHLPQQNPYNTGGHVYNLQHAQHHSQSYMNQQQQQQQQHHQPQHYNSQYQNSYGMLASNMNNSRENMPYNPGHEHMQNSASSQNQLPQHSQARQISQQNPQEIANNILQMATSNYIPNNTVQVPLNKNRSVPYQTSHSPPYNANSSYNMSMHPSIQPNQHFSYSSHSSHQLNNMRTSPISPMHLNSPLSHHSGQSLANSSPGSVQSPGNSNSVKSPVPTPPNVMGSIRSPHRKQPLASPTGSTHSLKSPTPNNQHLHNSGSQPSPHSALGNLQSPSHHSQGHYSPVSCSPHSHLGSPYQVSQSQSHSPVNQQNTSNKYMSEPQDFSNYIQAPPFNPLQSLQKLVMLPEKQVVDPKSVVGNSSVNNSTAPQELSDVCNSHQSYSKNLSASPEQCPPTQTHVIEGPRPNSLPFSSIQDEEMCMDGRHCSGESSSLNQKSSNTLSLQESESRSQDGMFYSGQISNDQTSDMHRDTHPVEIHKSVHEISPKKENLGATEENVSESCVKSVEKSIGNSNSVSGKEEVVVNVNTNPSACDNIHNGMSPVQKQSADELYVKHKWVKECTTYKTTNPSVGNPVDDDVEKLEVRKDFTSNYSRDSRYSVTPKKRYTQRLNYIEKNIAGENMESTSTISDMEDRTAKISVESANLIDKVQENICEGSVSAGVQPNKSNVLENSSIESDKAGTEKIVPDEHKEFNSKISFATSSDEITEKLDKSESVECESLKKDVTDVSKANINDNTSVGTKEEQEVLDSTEKDLKNDQDITLPNSIANITDKTDVTNHTPVESIKKNILSEVTQAQSNEVVLRRSSRKRNFIEKFQSCSTPKQKSNIYNLQSGKNSNTSDKQIKSNSSNQSVSSPETVDEKAKNNSKNVDKSTNVTEDENCELVTPEEKKKTVSKTTSSQSTTSEEAPKKKKVPTATLR